MKVNNYTPERVEQLRVYSPQMHTVLTTLVERLTNNWELICSGEQNGLKTALLSEANELLNKMNK